MTYFIMFVILNVDAATGSQLDSRASKWMQILAIGVPYDSNLKCWTAKA